MANISRSTPLGLDKRHVRRSFGRAAATYDDSAILQRQIADEMLDRLDVIKFEPRKVVDVGCATGYSVRRLQKRYRKALVVGLDLAPAMLRQAQRQRRWFRSQSFVAGDAEQLPVRDRSVDMVFSNATLQWCDLPRTFAEFARILTPGGLLMFSTFGPDTLREIRAAWREVDAGVHVHTFIDMHDIGDALVRSQFEAPVVDVDRALLTYSDVRDVLMELKRIGSHNAAADRSRGLQGKKQFAQFCEALERTRDEHGRLVCTYETVYGHAWAPDRLTQREDDGAVAVPISEVRRG